MRFLATIFILFLAIPAPLQAARLYTNGFELASLTQGVEFSSGGTGTLIAIESSPVHGGSSSIGIAPVIGFRWFGHVFSSSLVSSDIYVRTYIYVNSAVTTGEAEIISMYDSAGVARKVHVTLTTDGTLELNNPAGGQIGSDSAILNTNQWYRVELHVDHSSTFAEAFLDGVSFASSSAVATSDDYDAVYFGTPTSGATFDINWDDIAINDESGSLQVSLPGDGKVVYMRPNAAGDNAADTGVFSDLDEITPNDATDFVDLDTATSIADYNASSTSEYGIDSFDNITLVHVGARVREESSAATLYNLRLKSASGGTVSASSPDADIGDTTWRTNPVGGNNLMLNRLVSYTDPTTGVAWTPTGTNSLDNMQIGVATTNTSDVDVSALWARVEYTEGSPAAAPTPSVNAIWFDE